MERNKNNANAINAISIGIFCLLPLRLLHHRHISSRKCKFSQSLEDGWCIELIKMKINKRTQENETVETSKCIPTRTNEQRATSKRLWSVSDLILSLLYNEMINWRVHNYILIWLGDWFLITNQPISSRRSSKCLLKNSYLNLTICSSSSSSSSSYTQWTYFVSKGSDKDWW